MSWEKDLQDYAEHTRLDAPSIVEAQALVAMARRRASPRRLTARFALAAVAAAAVLAVLWPAEQAPLDSPVAQIMVAPLVAPEAPAEVPLHLKVGRTALRVDAVEVYAGGEVEVLVQASAQGPNAHTKLRLTQGRARFEVATRTDGASFNVDVGDYQVRVIGTAFEVNRSPFQVKVTEGLVEVSQAAQRWAIRAGERFADGRVYREKAEKTAKAASPAVQLPQLETLRSLVLSGQLSEAQSGLQRRLEADKRDVDTRVLSAQLEAKLGNRDAAVAHWEQIISQVPATPHAQRARYEAAVLLSEAPQRAEAHLRAFLTTRDPLTADARLRLARALLSQGKTADARAELQAVVVDHPGSTPARVARGLIEAN